jgi:hypothetical protein
MLPRGLGPDRQHHHRSGVEPRHVEEGHRDERAGGRRVRFWLRPLLGRDHRSAQAGQHGELDEAADAAVADDGTLGAARRAARVEDHGGAVLRDGLLREPRVGRAVEQLFEARLDLDDRHAQLLALDPGESLAVADDELRGAVADAVEDFVGHPPAVERRHDPSEAHRRPEGDEPLGAVGGEDRHAVARLDAAALAQRPGHGGHVPQMLRVADAAALVDDVLLVAECRGRFEQLAQRAPAVLDDLHRLAQNILLGDLEGGTGSHQPRVDLFQECHGGGLYQAPGGFRLRTRPADAERCALYSYSFGTAQIITNRSSFDLFLYWCISLGKTRAKSPCLISRSSPLSVTTAPRPSIT